MSSEQNSKKPAHIDGVVGGRRSLTDHLPLNRAKQTTLRSEDLHRPRKSFSPSELDDDLSRIQPSADPPKRRFWRRKKSAKRSRVKKTFIFSGLAVFAILAFLGIKFIIAIQNITERNLNGGALALQDNIDPAQLKGEGDGRVNILVIGIGGAGHPGGQLADTIMVVSIDPLNNEVAMLSVPRDLYLTVPGHYSMRINEVHAVGESDKTQKTKGGGPALLADNIEKVIGVDIHYYVRIDFDGFIRAVDTVGGIDINVENSVFDPFIENRFGSGKYGFSIKPGQQHLDGATALQYGRSRKTSSDFARADRQQAVLVALKNKILSLTTLTNPIKVSSLISAAGDHLRTDLAIPDEIMKLIEIAKRLDDSKVTNYVLSNAGDNYLSSQNINGASVLVPKAGLNNFKEIQKFVRSQFFVDGFIKQEAAAITVLNGTKTNSMATKVADYLKAYGYKVVNTGDAPQKGLPTTTIYDQSNGQKPFTLKLLEKRLKVGSAPGVAPGVTSSSDIVIIIGEDFKLP